MSSRPPEADVRGAHGPRAPADRAPRPGFVDVGGVRLFVEQWGAGPAVLCLHGLGGGTHFFSALGPAIAPAWRTIAFDIPGSGRSPLSHAFSFDAVADVVIALAAQLRIPEVVLVGHSLGTIVALEVVRRAPGLVRGLVTVGGLPAPLPPSRDRIARRIEIVARDGFAGMAETAVAANFARRTRDERPELTALFGRLFELQSAEGYVATATALVEWTARGLPMLGTTACLAVTGEEDMYAPPAAVRAFAATLPAGARVEVLADCGHLPFLEQPARFTALLSEWLESVTMHSSRRR